MFTINDPYSGNIFGRLGQGIAKGVSEQLPKEIERNRLSSGLNRLSESTEQNPLKQLAQLYGTPGITPEIANEAQKYIRQQSIINESKSRTKNLEETKKDKENDASPARLKSTPEAIREGGRNYISKYPQRYRDLQEAEDQYKTDLSNQHNQLKVINDRFKEVGDQLLNAMGKERYNKVLGELQRDIERRAEDAVISGKMSETEAADKYSKQLLDFSKTRNLLQTKGPELWAALFNSKKPKAEIEAARKEYENVGSQESFLNDLISYKNFSRPVASRIAYPPTEKVESELKKNKDSKGNFSNEKKSYDQILSNLKPNDSIQSIAYELNKKGYNPIEFLEYADENGNLNERQTRELQDIGNFNPSMSDILYFTLIGKGEL